jgi:hypothetical protein
VHTKKKLSTAFGLSLEKGKPGDQIGRICAFLAIIFFGHFLEIPE